MKKTRSIQTVMVIDDDVALARTFEQVLVKNHFVVHVFHNGKQALEQLARQPVDLVITDLYMDPLDGMEVVGAMKRLYPKIKIIAVSGGSEALKLDCLPVAKMLGADRTLPKPFDVATLLNAIDELDPGTVQ